MGRVEVPLSYQWRFLCLFSFYSHASAIVTSVNVLKERGGKGRWPVHRYVLSTVRV